MTEQLNREGPLPLYHQIANVIRSRIDLWEWAPGDQLPPETALAATFGVSPLTVRQALALLVQEERLRRHQGRGTFVTEQPAVADSIKFTAPLQDLTSAIARLKVQVLDMQRVRGPAGIAKVLGVGPGEEMMRVRRLRTQGKRVIAYTVSYVPACLGDQLSEDDLSNPLLLNALESKTGLCFDEAYQTIEACLADEQSAGLMNVPVGSPLLLAHRHYQVSDGTIAYVAVNRYASQLFRYELRFVRQLPQMWRIAPTAGAQSERRTAEASQLPSW